MRGLGESITDHPKGVGSNHKVEDDVIFPKPNRKFNFFLSKTKKNLFWGTLQLNKPTWLGILCVQKVIHLEWKIFHLAGKMSTKTFWMKLPSNRHLQQIFSWKDFWNTPTAPKIISPHHLPIIKKHIKKKTPKTTPSFKQKHNCRKTFPCLTWSSFFHPKMHWTWSSHWLLQRWDIRQWSARLYVVRKTLETEKELCSFWWFRFSEKKKESFHKKEGSPPNKNVGTKTTFFQFSRWKTRLV